MIRLPAAKLTFEEGFVDTPVDWYIVYRNPEFIPMDGSLFQKPEGVMESESPA